MARYYYTDPIKAAWMNQAFGFDFHYDLTDLNVNILGAYYVKTKNYIHPDCHKMLKPQVGDLIICDHMGEVKEIYEIREDWCSFSRDGGGCNFAGIREIIHRNGKAWFTPEVEGD